MRPLFLSLLLLALSACGLPSNVVVVLPEESGAVGKVIVSRGGSSAELDRAFAAVNAGSPASLQSGFEAKKADVEDEFGRLLAATPRAPVIYLLYFQAGSAVLDAGSRPSLEAAIAAARGTPDADIEVVGYADATGTPAANLALSSQRAAWVKTALVGAGVPGGIIATSYYGASNPRVPTPPGIAEPRNRRVEVTVR